MRTGERMTYQPRQALHCSGYCSARALSRRLPKRSYSRSRAARAEAPTVTTLTANTGSAGSAPQANVTSSEATVLHRIGARSTSRTATRYAQPSGTSPPRADALCARPALASTRLAVMDSRRRDSYTLVIYRRTTSTPCDDHRRMSATSRRIDKAQNERECNGTGGTTSPRGN